MRFKIFIVGVLVVKSFGTGLPGYYYKIRGIEKQKREFIKIMLPLIERGNKIVMQEREFVKRFFARGIQRNFRDLKTEDLSRMIYLKKKYEIDNFFNIDAYLKRVDRVPVSLALAQAAIESGWGKSRFVREANNIFGHWTYDGTGLVPNDRAEGKIHTIRIFATLQSSVNAYVLNLNRNAAYKLFRKMRLNYAKKHMLFNGIEAAQTMINYSQLREKYVKILVNLIESANLLYYDFYKPASLMDSA